jgi:S1-C subfamily serine protease
MAGLAAGDIILKVNDKTTERIEDLVGQLHKKRIGDTVRIVAFSEGREQLFEVTLSKTP